jgi:hypothetical protein
LGFVLFIAAHLFPGRRRSSFSRTQHRKQFAAKPRASDQSGLLRLDPEPSTPSTIGLLSRHTGTGVSRVSLSNPACKHNLFPRATIKLYLHFVPSRRPWRKYHNAVPRVQFHHGLLPWLLTTSARRRQPKGVCRRENPTAKAQRCFPLAPIGPSLMKVGRWFRPQG